MDFKVGISKIVKNIRFSKKSKVLRSVEREAARAVTLAKKRARGYSLSFSAVSVCSSGGSVVMLPSSST